MKSFSHAWGASGVSPAELASEYSLSDSYPFKNAESGSEGESGEGDSWLMVRMSGSSYASPVLSDHNALRATLSLEGKKVDVGEPTPVVDVPPVSDVPSPG